MQRAGGSTGMQKAAELLSKAGQSVGDVTALHEAKQDLQRLLLAVTSADGMSWSDPIEMYLPIIPNHGPHRTQSCQILSGDKNLTLMLREQGSRIIGYKIMFRV
ncbi:hypothetical protein PAECIP111802_06772 [Paenibacillus allorhizosphaerae]|uniref:Uncharacterized protein n=1 Tax=Paenibacillus allorhizosphaerae TaxID=2849866 RepID=A0ABM8VT99_9BACL|nr:hypothetical protein PAECIP111802_06772 [Paenibacillus allorhizosphaerae]